MRMHIFNAGIAFGLCVHDLYYAGESRIDARDQGRAMIQSAARLSVIECARVKAVTSAVRS
jgi:hypothetical protein